MFTAYSPVTVLGKFKLRYPVAGRVLGGVASMCPVTKDPLKEDMMYEISV